MLNLDLNQVRKEAGSVGPFLAPFVKMACIYFVLDLPEDQPSLGAALVKCLPITSLMIFVGAQSLRGNSYNQRILAGLALSCVGDAVLIWQGNDIAFFLVGMLFFSLAQLVYLSAFGFQAVALKELLICFCIWAACLAILFPCLPSALTVPIVAYSVLLGVVFWRALARFTLQGDIPWRKIYAAMGACLFFISDLILAMNKFCFDMPYQRQMIMFTYYAAQMCYALSVINSRLMYEPSATTYTVHNPSTVPSRSHSATSLTSLASQPSSPSNSSPNLPASSAHRS